MAKLARESRLRERREEKRARKEARKRAPAQDPDLPSDTPIGMVDEPAETEDGRPAHAPITQLLEDA